MVCHRCRARGLLRLCQGKTLRDSRRRPGKAIPQGYGFPRRVWLTEWRDLRYPFSLQNMRITTLVASTVCLVAALVAGAQNTKHSGPWELEDSGSTAGLRGIHAVGGGVVWASGTGGTILRSEDTGYLCTVRHAAGRERAGLSRCLGLGRAKCFGFIEGPGDQSRLYQTTDGCNSWKLLLTNPDAAGFWDGLSSGTGNRASSTVIRWETRDVLIM